jgi:ribosomal protein L3 glutamine methyltransferase
MAAKPRTLSDWLRWAEARYARHPVALGQVATTAHDEALYLLLHGVGLPLDSRPGVMRRLVTAEEAEKLEELFERRLKDRVPAAYLTREAWLGPHRFYVDERVIIPRSYFLELLPEQIPQWLPARQPVRRVVDVCTGSGCLAVLLARRFRRAKVDAIEISSDALTVARFNVAQHRLAERIRLWRSDVFDAVPRARYDLILSNPPYVPARELADLPPEFRREPALALDGGRDGFDVIRKILHQARDRLQPHGILVLEVGGLRAAMDRRFAELEPHWLHTADGEDCVCVIQQARLAAWRE